MSVFAKTQKRATAFTVIFKILLLGAFIFESVYMAEMAYNSLPYLSGMGGVNFSHLAFIFSMGIISFLLYLLISSFAFTMSSRIFCSTTMQNTFIPYRKVDFALNLDFCYLIALIILGCFNFLYYAYSFSYLFVWLVKIAVITPCLGLFYYLMQRGVEKKYKRPILAAYLMPFALLIAFV